MKRRFVRWFMRRQLLNMLISTQGRINNGDLDFDDWVYRTRDACLTLLMLHFPEAKTRR